MGSLHVCSLRHSVDHDAQIVVGRGMITSRRSILTGLVALVAAPAIVRAGSSIGLPVITRADDTRDAEIVRCLSFVVPEQIRVDASYQSGSTLVVRPLPRALECGDIITIDEVFAWHRPDNTPVRRQRQFVVVRPAKAGEVLVHFYPPIIGEHDPRYRTVVDYPMNRAIVRVLPRQHSAA